MKSGKILFMKKFLVICLAFLISACANSHVNEDITESKDGKYLYEMGVSYLNSGNNAMAITYFQEAIKTYDKPEVYNALALSYQLAGEIQKAESIFKEGLEKYPSYPELLTNYGILLASQGKYDMAISFLEKAANHPSYTRKEIAYYNLALIYLTLNKEELFLSNMEKALMLNSNYLNPYISLSDYFFEKYRITKDKEFLKKARFYLSKAINLQQNDPVLYFKIGQVYNELNERDLALYYLDKALKLSTNNNLLKEEIRKYILEVIEKPKNDNNKNINLKDNDNKTFKSEDVINILKEN